MPVRKIKPSYTVVTGSVSSLTNKNMSDFEGPLEWQYLIILEFDWDNEIESFEVQPVTITYHIRSNRRQYKYTPDVLVRYRDGSPPCLIEVKSRRFLKKKWSELKPKLRAGIHYARINSMRFKIITDVEIFTPFLENARFLRQYKNLTPSSTDTSLILKQITEVDISTPARLLANITENKASQAELIPALWYLVANRLIGVDIDKKIHMHSEIWPVID